MTRYFPLVFPVLSFPGWGLATPGTYLGSGTAPPPLSFRAITLWTVTGLISQALPIRVNLDPK